MVNYALDLDQLIELNYQCIILSVWHEMSFPHASFVLWELALYSDCLFHTVINQIKVSISKLNWALSQILWCYHCTTNHILSLKPVLLLTSTYGVLLMFCYVIFLYIVFHKVWYMIKTGLVKRIGVGCFSLCPFPNGACWPQCLAIFLIVEEAERPSCHKTNI